MRVAENTGDCIACGKNEFSPYQTIDKNQKNELIVCSCGLARLEKLPGNSVITGYYQDDFYAYLTGSRFTGMFDDLYNFSRKRRAFHIYQKTQLLIPVKFLEQTFLDFFFKNRSALFNFMKNTEKTYRDIAKAVSSLLFASISFIPAFIFTALTVTIKRGDIMTFYCRKKHMG